MKTYVTPLILIALSIVSTNLFSQKQENTKGKVFGKLYFDYYTETGAGNNASAMEVKRIYFGYKRNINEHLQAIIKLDIGNPLELPTKDHIKRYAYFKNAKIKYHKDKLTVNVGITDVLMIPVPEKYWGHRYINKAYTDRFKFSPKADIGANATYKFNDFFSVDLGIYNGEGYSKLQGDNTFRGGLGLSFMPLKGLLLRSYFDYAGKDTARSTLALFLGYKYKDKGVFGVEYNYQKNNSFLDKHDIFGYSLYGTWNFTEKWQFFARFDQFNSNKLTGETTPWDILGNGKAITTGIQYAVIQGVKTSLNFQNWMPEDASQSVRNFIYLNLEVKF